MDLSQQNATSLAQIKRSNHRSKTVARKKRSIRDYEFVYNENSKVQTSDLGAGAYGNVKRVREKATGQVFAMKIISKQNIFRYSNKENLRREISIQKGILHPHIIGLKHYFEDSENVYIVLEYAENGTLFEYIRRKKKCSENESFIYFFQTALALDYLHKRNIIHRDIKPENLLLDKSGNVKVCDFGWSAEAENAKRQTFCGTIDYMAPEMIKNLPYDYHIDIWSLGVLLYELLHGKAPFRGRNDEEKCKNIAKNAEIAFDSALSPEVCDLITKILKPNPVERLTMLEIFNHRWMKKYEIIYNIDVMSYVFQQDSSTGEVSLINESQLDSPQGSLEDVDAKRGEKREPSIERKAKSQPLGGERNIRFGIGKELNLKPSIGQTSTKESDDNSRPGSGAITSCSLDKEIVSNSSRNRVLQFEFEHEKSKQFIEDSYRIANPLFMNKKGTNSDQERSRNRFLQPINTDKDFKRFKSTGREPINSLFGTTRREGERYVYYNDNVEDEGRSLMSLYKKNQQIERKFQQLKHPKKELGFFEKILMGIGCISRDGKTHVGV